MKRFVSSQVFATGLLGALALLGTATAQTVTTAFTYQGELSADGTPVSGLYDFQFKLYNPLGTQIAGTLCADDILVTDGRFVVVLDFDSRFAFNGSQRLLEVLVRPDSGQACSDPAGFTALAPRQAVLATPYASRAMNASNADIANTALSADNAGNATAFEGRPAAFYQDATNLASGTLPAARLEGPYTRAVQFSHVSNTFQGSFTGSFTGGGAGLNALNATSLASGTVADARLSGNVALLSATQSFTGVQAFLNPANAFTGTFTGNGATLTSLHASAITTGTLPDARLSATVARLNAAQTFTARQTFSAAAGTQFSPGVAIGLASNLSPMYIASSRVSR